MWYQKYQKLSDTELKVISYKILKCICHVSITSFTEISCHKRVITMLVSTSNQYPHFKTQLSVIPSQAGQCGSFLLQPNSSDSFQILLYKTHDFFYIYRLKCLHFSNHILTITYYFSSLFINFCTKIFKIQLALYELTTEIIIRAVLSNI